MSSSQQWLNAVASVGPVDWAAAAVFVVLVIGAFATLRRGWQAPESFFAQYREDRARTKAAIDADHILPDLAGLIAEVNSEVANAVAGDSPIVDRAVLSDTDVLSSNLQWAGYAPHLEALSRLYAEYNLLDRLFDAAVRWARRKAAGSGVGGCALVVLGWRASLAHSHLPDSIAAVAGVVGLIALGWSVACWGEEIYSRNRLSRLFRAYE